jgi:DNA repair protein RadC
MLTLVILDEDGQPRDRLHPDGNWPCLVAHLLASDARRVILHQRRHTAAPQPVDIALTRSLHRRLRALDIHLADHRIDTPSGCFSFRDAGLL